jgi:hypothetical protein
MGDYSFLKQLLAEILDLEYEDTDYGESIFLGEQVISRNDVINLVERAIRHEGGQNGPEF